MPLGMTRTSRAPSSRAASASAVDGADHEPRPPQNAARERGRAPRQLHVRAPELDDERLAGQRGDGARREPVRVHEVGVARRPPRGAREGGEHRRQEQRLRRARAQVADDAGAVGDPEVAEPGRRDDLDLDPPRAQRLHGVADEVPGRVAGVARVRGGEDGDAQAPYCRPVHRITRDQVIWAFGPELEPVLEIDPGETVTFETNDCFSGQIRSENDLVTGIDMSRINSATGPVAVRGAEPGDSLIAEILDVRPIEWGVAALIPGFGQLDRPGAGAGDADLRGARRRGAHERPRALPGAADGRRGRRRDGR